MQRRNQSYDEWLRRVDHILVSRIGLTTDDVMDWAFYTDAYDNGYSPTRTANEAVQAVA